STVTSSLLPFPTPPNPHRPLNPAKASGQRLQRRVAQDVARKAWRANVKTIHGSPESASRRDRRNHLELHQHQDRRFWSDRAGQVPPLTVDLAGVLISPNEISPGPISTRTPSIDSTNQRPDKGMIHCGRGFSCQSPIQPTGSTVTNTVP